MNSLAVKLIKLLCCVFALLILVVNAHALTISPLPQIEIPVGERAVTLRATDDDKFYEATIYKVSQTPDGQEKWEESDDIMVYPSPFKAPKNVRIVMTKPIPRDVESYYRLKLTEIAPKSEDLKEGIHTILSFSIPIFVFPNKEQPGKDLNCGDTGNTIVINNTGNVHLKYIREKGGMLYVMPHTRVEIPKEVIKDVEGKAICK